jgi:hypothetical protein
VITIANPGLVELRSLSVQATGNSSTALPGKTGGSATAIYVASAPGGLKLVGASVLAFTAQAGGQGVKGETPVPGTPTSACDSAGSGGEGMTPPNGGVQTVDGVFLSTGFQGGRGDPGGQGSPGSNGTAPNLQKTYTKTTCSGKTAPTCAGSEVVTSDVKTLPAGHVGCGGLGGLGGLGGGQGGGSFGIYLAVDAPVTLVGSQVSSSASGGGAPGGNGGPGAFGASALQKADPLTAVPNAPGKCSWTTPAGSLPICRAALPATTPYLPPPSGGVGGRGGTGSKGGAGRGGPVVAIVAKNAASIVVSPSSTLLAKSPGGGGAGTTPALAKPIHTY